MREMETYPESARGLIEIQELIQDCQPPYVELAGPTPRGFTFLKELGLRYPKDDFEVTNIKNPIQHDKFLDNQPSYSVDSVVDVKDLPYEPDSIGMYRVCGLPVYVDASNLESESQVESEFWLNDPANYDLKQASNLHLVLFRGAFETLRPGGVLIYQSPLELDTQLANKIGFEALIDFDNERNLGGQIYLKPNY